MPAGHCRLLYCAALLGAGCLAGCQSPVVLRSQGPDIGGAPFARPGVRPFIASVPTEKSKVTLPEYIIEPPDILLIDVIKLVPKAPYKIEPLDVLQIEATGTPPDAPIKGNFIVDPSGRVALGPMYDAVGKVKVSGLTSDEAQAAVFKLLDQILTNPEVSVSLYSSASQQPIADQHLVTQDGTVNLGSYGSVYVAGMTLAQARVAIEAQVSKSLEAPKVSLDVFAYNSKVYYIITEGGGFNGDLLVRVPVTGNETVLDALAQVNGLSRYSSKNIWLARPAPGGVGCDQILPVNWEEIAKGAATATNYQVLPGDRLFIAQDKLVALETLVTRVTAPFERAFGFTLLGAQTIQTLNRFPLGFQGGGAI